MFAILHLLRMIADLFKSRWRLAILVFISPTIAPATIVAPTAAKLPTTTGPANEAFPMPTGSLQPFFRRLIDDAFGDLS
jgi:hypothetical protein